jgi:hypothetical protein
VLIISRAAVYTFAAGALILMAAFSELATFFWIGFPSLQMLTAAVIAGAGLLALQAQSSPALWGVIVYGGYMSLVTVAGVFISQSPLQLVQIVIFLLLPFGLLVLGQNASREGLQRFLIGVLVVIFTFTVLERLGFWFGFGALGLSEFSLRMKLHAHEIGGQFPVLGRATGVFINPNTLGYVAGCLLFSILILSKVNVGIWQMILSIMSILLIAMSGSRGSMLALGAAILTYLVYMRSGRALIYVTLLAIFLTLAYFVAASQNASTFALFLDRIQNDWNVESGSWTGRLQFWSSVWERGNLPIGTLVSPELALGHAIDSFYVRVMAQGGVIGLATGVLLFVGLGLQGGRLPTHLKGPYMALVVFMLVNGFSMLSVQTTACLFVWAVIGFAANRSVGEHAASRMAVGRRRTRLGPLMATRYSGMRSMLAVTFGPRFRNKDEAKLRPRLRRYLHVSPVQPAQRRLS